MWIKRLNMLPQQAAWKHILKASVEKLGGLNLLLKCDFDVEKLNCKLCSYHGEILEAWSKLENGNKSIVWNNKSILINGNSVFWDALFDNGVLHVADLFYPDSKPKQFRYWIERGVKAGLFLRYIGLIQASRGQLENGQGNQGVFEQELLVDLGDKKMPILNINSKIMYHHLVSRKTLEPVGKYVFIRILDPHDDVWEELYTIPFRCAMETELRSFQFKVLHNIIATQEKLKRYKWPS